MSVPPAGKLPLPELAAMKRRGDRIVMVTAYDAPGARFAEDAGIDAILVGDTAAMVVLGHEGTTVPVTVDEMLFLTRTVSRQARRPLVIGDMPFGSYQVSDEDAVRNAIRFVKEGGADIVKLEGAGPMTSRTRTIVEAGIPVMGHIGWTPQAKHGMGGKVRVQGKSVEQARALLHDALAIQEAGAFSIVLELVPGQLAAAITERLRIPTIGIGAGAGCSGQVLVITDLLGLGSFVPRHARPYAHLREEILEAATKFAADVAAGTFPGPEETVRMDDIVLEEALGRGHLDRPADVVAGGIPLDRDL